MRCSSALCIVTANDLLTVRGLYVADARGREIVSGFSLSLGCGETVALEGPSGSGKSTLALASLGLLPPGLSIVGGEVRLLAHDVPALTEAQWRPLRGRAAIVFQDANASLNPRVPCGDQVDFALRLHTQLDRPARRARVVEAFRACRLASTDAEAQAVYKSLPGSLSGGQRQRVLFTLVTILGPQVLIADEPTASLDPETARVLVDLLATYVREHRAGLLLITHQPEPFRDLIGRTERLAARRDAVIATPPASPPAPAAKRLVVQVRGLSKRFPDANSSSWVLRGFSLDLCAGEVLALSGPSGVGKSTVGRCIAGLLPWEEGDVLLDGMPLPPLEAGRPFPVQMVHQSPYASLSPRRTVGATLGEALAAAGRSSQDSVAALLAQVLLPADFAARLPAELSGGERQRVAIARCLAVRPRVLVADEPTASLDSQAVEVVLGLVQTLAREWGMACLLVTHSERDARRFADRSLRLQRPTGAP